MSVTTTGVDAGEFRYIVSARVWFQHRRTVMQQAAREARRRGLRAAGHPDEEMVTLVWRQDQTDTAA
jgi:hypothetical protein